MDKNYYQLLDIPENASQEQIKKAFRGKAKQHHPDKGGNAEVFKIINEAYEILSDADKRNKYDLQLQVSRNKQKQQFHYNSPFDDFVNNSKRRDFNFTNPFFNDFFESYTSFDFEAERKKYKQSNEQSNNNNYKKKETPKKGEDLRIKMSLTLDEVINGAIKKIKYNRKHRCSVCNGNGTRHEHSQPSTCELCFGSGSIRIQRFENGAFIIQTAVCGKCQGTGTYSVDKCSPCQGTGFVEEPITKDIIIPKGIREGKIITIPEGGNAPLEKGGYGNLIIIIDEIKDDTFIVDKLNLIYELYIGISDAIIGTEEEITVFNERIKIKIEPNTDNGRIIKLKGKGIPDYNNRHIKGDLIIYINIFIPTINKQTDSEAIELLKQLKTIKSFTPNSENLLNKQGFYHKMKNFNDLH